MGLAALTGQAKLAAAGRTRMKQEYLGLARRSLLLASVPENIFVELLSQAHIRSFDRGATIFLQGERASAIYIVAEGWVKLYRISPNGAEAVVGVFTLIRIEADSFLRIIRESPEVAISMLSATFAHLHALVGQVEQLKAQTGPQRVAEFLLDLAPCPAGACEVTLPYDKVLIAGRLGMKPESLSRAFVRLKDHGVTIRQNVAVIDDIAVLRDYIEEDPALAWSKH
jgi:CRP/FNR family transcriptional regulator, dissimilatory nitrate respiration regulator